MSLLGIYETAHQRATEGIKHMNKSTCCCQKHKSSVITELHNIGFWNISPKRKYFERALEIVNKSEPVRNSN